MKVILIAVASIVTWTGLFVGLVVGVVFGTLASISTVFMASFNQAFRDELVQSAEATARVLVGATKRLDARATGAGSEASGQ
jgi:hypothetical protein